MRRSFPLARAYTFASRLSLEDLFRTAADSPRTAQLVDAPLCFERIQEIQSEKEPALLSTGIHKGDRLARCKVSFTSR